MHLLFTKHFLSLYNKLVFQYYLMLLVKYDYRNNSTKITVTYKITNFFQGCKKPLTCFRGTPGFLGIRIVKHWAKQKEEKVLRYRNDFGLPRWILVDVASIFYSYELELKGSKMWQLIEVSLCTHGTPWWTRKCVALMIESNFYLISRRWYGFRLLNNRPIH
jgi:hypothetical protein